MKPQVEAWLRQARDDLAMARLAAEAEFHAQACYHASQAAEKALKGVLIGLDLESPRTHALERLVESLGEAGVEVEPLREWRLRVLSLMNSATRSPDGDEVLRSAEAVLVFVEGLG
jgi:HEPN domain-containing protein